MKFITFEDPTGIYETVFFPKVYHQYCHLLNAERTYIIKGRVEEDFGAVTVTVHWMGFLDRGSSSGYQGKRIRKNGQVFQGREKIPSGMHQEGKSLLPDTWYSSIRVPHPEMVR